MTRETKIGLLVGLAFIIVIGILLSDYNRSEQQPAALNAVAGDVQKGSATPHNNSTESAILPPPSAPRNTVPTRADLHPPITPPRDNHSTVAMGNPPGPAAPSTPSTPPSPVTPLPPVTPPATPPHRTEGGPTNLIREHPEDLTPVGPTQPTPPQPTKPPTVNGATAYVAVSGDTVSRLAGRFLGGNTTANREAILKINPSLQQNPDKITVGKTYMIPPKATAAAPAAPTASPPRTAAATPPATPAADQHYYTVKENDSLWRIATEQLGDSNAVETLKDLNKEVLKGSTTLRINMRLRLPPKTVASTN